MIIPFLQIKSSRFDVDISKMNIKLLHKTILFILTVLFIQTGAFAQTWNQMGPDIDGEAEDDWSGWTVSMPTANTMAIGAPNNDGKASNAGKVSVFSWSDTGWVQKGNDIHGEAAEDQSGWSVSMPDANNVAIGSRKNQNTGTNAGHVRIFTWNGVDWVQKGNDIDGEGAGDMFGYAVSMPDSNTVAIGAPYNYEKAAYAGHVRVFTWNGVAWTQKGIDIDGEAEDDNSGCSISMPDANTLAIGARYNDGTATDAGHVRIYNWNGSKWMQKGNDIDGEAEYDNSGVSVSMPDSNTVAIGAIFNNNGIVPNAGHVRIYSWNGTAWVKKGADIDGEGDNDRSGGSVCMPDANTVAIGAIYNADAGIRAGHTRIYHWNGSNWVTVGADIDGEAAENQFGFSVSMPDEITIAVGAPYNSKKAGHVRIYKLCKNSSESISKTACFSYVSPSKKYTYTKSDTYYDTIANASGCDSVIIINLTINSADVSVNNSSPTLTANATGATYQWLNCDSNFNKIDTANNQTFLAISNGNYAVEVTQNGCIDTSQCINVSNANILENTFGYQLKVYPNPTKDDATIELGNHYNEVLVIIRNTLGQEVMRTSVNKTNAFNLNIPGVPGLYILELHTTDHKALLRVLKN